MSDSNKRKVPEHHLNENDNFWRPGYGNMYVLKHDMYNGSVWLTKFIRTTSEGRLHPKMIGLLRPALVSRSVLSSQMNSSLV